MSSARHELLDWAERGLLRPQYLPQALAMAGAIPGAVDWRRFIDSLLLWLGVVLAASGLIFFFAYNWDALGRFGKFGLVELPLAGAILAAWYLGLDRVPGQAALVGAALLTGALLALIGQTYQTGADPWELFAVWALLLVPWSLAARVAALWLLLVLLLNLALSLYFQVMHGMLGFLLGRPTPLWALLALNGTALVAWEIAAAYGCPWLKRWGARTIATAAGAAATAIALWWVVEAKQIGPYALPAYGIWLGAVVAQYRFRLLDPFMLSGALLSGILVIAALAGRHLSHQGAAMGFLFTGLLVIVLSAAGARWIHSLVQERQP